MSTAAHDSRPQKRPRPSDDSSPQTSDNGTTLVSPGPSDLRRHSEDLWLDDGNVILAAKNSAFRVLRSLLASQSTVFADMFSSCSDAGEMFDGCPVVHVSDAPEDVAHFLRVLLPTSERVLFARKFSFSFHQISAIICLAHKYNVQDIFDQAIAFLQDHFTHDFDVWESDTDGSVIDIQPEQAIGVINLARLVDRPCFLPIAFYKCALLGSSIMDGYRHEDGSVEHLSQEDIKRCIDGHHRLVEASLTILLDVFIPTPCKTCEGPPSCETALQWMLREAIKSIRQSSPSAVLRGWDDWIRVGAQESHLCSLCEAAAIKREYRVRKRVWNTLPNMFKLAVDGWPSGASGGEEDAAVAAAP